MLVQQERLVSLRVTGNSLRRTLPVSAVLITYNETENIRRTLSRLFWCDEIIVVDSYSTDDTVDACRLFGAKVFFKEFEGYGAQKRFAISKATNDWVLCLDADEVLSDALIDEICREWEDGPRGAGYLLPMNLVFLGREFTHGRESGRHFLRLFNRRHGNVNEALVHEKIELDGTVRKLRHHILHYSYRDIHQWYVKCDRYTTLAAREAVRRGKRKSRLAVFFSFPYYFIHYFVINGNWLNGMEGFYWSAYSALYHFTKYLKIRELQK
ncbi:glycosyltransferase family 2 protein [Dinghuibacter silviterrae]|uniref:Glycosyltransferase involved in cell wall biosynthesis n=1 Tax=Dinghuibacter silviterrae TaxID=1539049 RepID=A0A4R8DXP9_9BACT|nr:glycosyltransferase family 2 protein [Dinghuibacter silviterrae]TDX01991.1 glycosyltransferase involved in cell wall biosynthesis [Dinghuibacter silviterrae]